MEKYIKKILKLAQKASQKGDVPVAAIIVKDNKIISKAYNKKENRKNAILHAEIIAISQACKKLRSWHLDDCILISSMEPCMMCSGAIIQSRIKKVYYLVKNEKYGCTQLLKNSKIECIQVENNAEILILLSDFFENRR